MFLETISRVNFHKWHSQVRIVIKDFEFEVIALIDSGADLNCIHEGIIPPRFYRKSKERLASASGGKMQIEYDIPQAEVCQGGISFMTKFVLVKNMTDSVILGNPFLCLLYPFTTDNEGITAHPFNQPIKFEFVRSPAPWEIKSLQKASIAKTLSTLTAYDQAQNLDSAKTIDCPSSHNQLSSCINIFAYLHPSVLKGKGFLTSPLKSYFIQNFLGRK